MSPATARPETLGQARRWDRVKARYVGHGLCHSCASQAAWGHQGGFSTVRPPCRTCAVIVASFTVAKVNRWRVPGDGGKTGTGGVLMCVSDQPGVSVPAGRSRTSDHVTSVVEAAA